MHVARAELVLARPITDPLRAVPLKPDPLSAFAEVVGSLKDDLGDRLDVVLDLVPMNAAQARHLAGTLATQHAGRTTVGGRVTALWGEVLEVVREDPLASRRGRSRPARGEPVRVRTKFDDPEPCFAVQFLVRVESEIPGRAPGLLHKVLAAVDQFSGENWFTVRSINLGVSRLGADSWLRRRSFDRRFASGKVDRRLLKQVLTARELFPLLKPPTKHCASPNVERSGGKVPAPPKTLPVYRPGDVGVIPLGYAVGSDGREVLLGMAIEELLFSFRIGKSGFGKTEMALCQAIALALGTSPQPRRAEGLWFLDPHGDGWTRAKPYLAVPGVRERIWEIDLTVRDHSAPLAGWNLLSMEGYSRESIEDKVDMVVSSFAAALAWGDSAPRAKTLLTKACETLCELAVLLPPQLAPTIFQIPRLLEDELWRSSILAYLPPGLQNYWQISFARIPAEATSPVTNLITRLRSSPTLSAFFGATRSSYDARRAMDCGAIVMVCPPGAGETSKLVSCLLIYDLFRAGRSRGDAPTADRPRFDVFVDELTHVDGAARGSIAAILEQLRKFNVRLHAMTQMADRLTEDTKRALIQNQSMLATCAGGVDEVKVATRQWGGEVSAETAAKLPRYHHILAVQHHTQVTLPFKVRGAEVTELFAQAAHPEMLPDLQAALDRNMRRTPIRQTLADLDELDERITHWLAANARPRMSRADAPAPQPQRDPQRRGSVPTHAAAAKARTTAPSKAPAQKPGSDLAPSSDSAPAPDAPPVWDHHAIGSLLGDPPPEGNVVPLRRK